MEKEWKGSFKTIVSVLIALVAVSGAFVAWRASQAQDRASALDSAGIKAALNSANAEISVSSQLYLNQYSFDSYFLRYQSAQYLAESRTRIPTSLEGDPNVVDSLFFQQMREINRAALSRDLVDPNYLKEVDDDMEFEVERLRRAAWSEIATVEDLDPSKSFTQADLAREEVSNLVLAAVVLSASLIFFTASLITAGSAKFLWVSLGILIYGSGVLAAFIQPFA